MIISRKIFTEEQLNIISSLSESCNITNTTAKILYSRGYVTKEDINGFLYPDRSLFHNPYDLKNLDLAVERIKCAKENGETVVVFGDYDADGICATTILCKALRIFGVEVIPVIPERENGYGLTEESIELVLNEYFPDLIITVDCGISSYNEIEYLKDLGVDVIVTDHHEIPETVPDCIAVNCKFKDQNYPFDCLSGAGVAYKLASALIGDRANMFLDLVTVATVADNMPLIDENRLIVKEGIELIKKGLSNKPLKSIISLSGIKEITSSSIAYGIVPRVNASGRMGDAHTALKLFLSENDDEIFELSNKLLIYNNERKSEGDGLYLEAKAKLPKGNYGNVIVLHNENWNTGLVGIISAKIAEEYNLPALLFTKSGEYYHGSARSIDSVNIYECILECKELLKGFGGHSQAAGVTIDESNLESFAIKLNEVIKNKYTFNDFERKIEIDEVIEKAPSKKFLNELALLEPFGIGNKEPVFLKTVESVESKIFKNLHLSFKDSGMDFIYFNGIRDHTVLSLDCKKYLIVEPSLSVYNGKESIKCQVKNIVGVDFGGDELYKHAFIRAVKSLKSEGLTDYKKAKTSDIKNLLKSSLQSRFGTLFVLNNPKNKGAYEEFSLSLNFLNLTERGGRNCLLVGGLIEGMDLSLYNKIVHLDKPLSVIEIKGKEIIVNDEIEAFSLSAVKPYREDFISVYLKLVKIINAGVNCSINAYNQAITEFSFEQVAFSGEVFKELGFIKAGELLYLDKTVKKDLTESTIYKKLLKIKELL